MFTGIIQSIATIQNVSDGNGIRTFVITFETGFTEGLAIGASVAVDGVCLTVSEIISAEKVSFDVMFTSLQITTLSEYQAGTKVNVERAAKEGAEIGGHPLSGHIDFKACISKVIQNGDNYCIRVALTNDWLKYVFPKGYIALNGASLTIAEVNKTELWFEVWLIPETRRMTSFESKREGDFINIEIERSTQVLVDTVRDAVKEELADLRPLLEKWLETQGVNLDEIAGSIQTSINAKTYS
jgi:riboflavin synthase